MVNGLWGKKVGMTQVFSGNKVVPVTVIDVANWYITGVKTEAKDGYNAIQIGCLRSRYQGMDFNPHWLKTLTKYFALVREVKLSAASDAYAVGQAAEFGANLAEGGSVDVTGITKGCGFAGVMKRLGFAGGRSSHGSTFHRRPGGISHMRSRGRVIKGKGMPGRMGGNTRVMKNLAVVRIDADARIVLIKGSVPGKAGSFVHLSNRG
jgi:large subunit ribosomal protein L3